MTSSAPTPEPRSGAIRAIVYPVSGLANVTRSSTPSSTAPPPWPATIAGIKTIFHPDHPWPVTGVPELPGPAPAPGTATRAAHKAVITRLNSKCMWSLWLDSRAGCGQAAVDQVGPVLDLLQLALDDPDQAVHVGGGEVGHGPLEQRPDARPDSGLACTRPAGIPTADERGPRAAAQGEDAKA